MQFSDPFFFGNEIQLLLMFRYIFRVSLSKVRVCTPTHEQMHELTKSEKGTTEIGFRLLPRIVQM